MIRLRGYRKFDVLLDKIKENILQNQCKQVPESYTIVALGQIENFWEQELRKFWISLEVFTISQGIIQVRFNYSSVANNVFQLYGTVLFYAIKSSNVFCVELSLLVSDLAVWPGLCDIMSMAL